MSDSRSLSDQLWSTPSYGNEPSRWFHVKTTAKQIQVKNTPTQRFTERFSRDGKLPESAIAYKAGFGDGHRYLFASRIDCLRFMAARAREQAERADQKAARLRQEADELDLAAKSALSSDEQEAR